MATKVYEGMFLLDSNRYARDPGGVSGQITQIVEKCGGEILASRLWNEQKLAYAIAGHRKGTYWLTYFRLDSEKQGELTRACRLNENILRNLVIRIDDRLVDTLVRHASASGSASTTDKTTGPSDTAVKDAPASDTAVKDAPASDTAVKDAPASDTAVKDAPAAADTTDEQVAGESSEKS